jgi:hypothetical protein
MYSKQPLALGEYKGSQGVTMEKHHHLTVAGANPLDLPIPTGSCDSGAALPALSRVTCLNCSLQRILRKAFQEFSEHHS